MRLIAPMDWDIFFEIIFVWLWKESLSSRIMPKNLVWLTRVRAMLRIIRSGAGWLTLFENNMNVVLEIFNDRRLAFSQMSIFSNWLFISEKRVKIFLPEIETVVSSAKWMKLRFAQFDMSFMYKRKSMGPRMEPWGTPRVILDTVE